MKTITKKKVASVKTKIGFNYVNVKPTKKAVKAPISNTVSVATNPLLAALVEEDNFTLTENGATTFRSTLNHCLDFFAMGAALRTCNDASVISLFSKAFAENPLLATKALFNTRNIRGGAGERKSFRTILKWMGDNHPEIIQKNIANIPYFGRFDDLFVLFGTKSEKFALDLIKDQLEKDCKIYNDNLD